MSHQIAVQIYNTSLATGYDELVYDWSAIAQGLTFTTNKHGFEACNFTVPVGFVDASEGFRVGLKLTVTSSALTVFEGRLDNIEIAGASATIKALGYWSAFEDLVYTVNWTDDGFALWTPMTEDDQADMVPSRYEQNNDARLLLAPRKGEQYGPGNDARCGYYYRHPRGSAWGFTYLEFDWEWTSKSKDWEMEVRGWDNYGFLGASDLIFSTSGSVPGSSGSQVLNTLTEYFILTFQIYTTKNGTHGDDTGEMFFEATNVRIARETPPITLGLIAAART